MSDKLSKSCRKHRKHDNDPRIRGKRNEFDNDEDRIIWSETTDEIDDNKNGKEKNVNED